MSKRAKTTTRIRPFRRTAQCLVYTIAFVVEPDTDGMPSALEGAMDHLRAVGGAVVTNIETRDGKLSDLV